MGDCGSGVVREKLAVVLMTECGTVVRVLPGSGELHTPLWVAQSGFLPRFNASNQSQVLMRHCLSPWWGVIDVCALPTHHVVSAVGPLSSYQETMVKAFLPYLVDPHPLSVRKRAYIALCESGVKTLPQTSSAVIAYH